VTNCFVQNSYAPITYACMEELAITALDHRGTFLRHRVHAHQFTLVCVVKVSTNATRVLLF